jgi:hypothetical protein
VPPNSPLQELSDKLLTIVFLLVLCVAFSRLVAARAVYDQITPIGATEGSSFGRMSLHVGRGL